MSTYVSEDPTFFLALGANDYLEFEIMQSDKDDAEPDEESDGRAYTLRMQLNGGTVVSKSATASGNVVRFTFEPSDVGAVGVYVATVWDDATGRVLQPPVFAVPVQAVIGTPP